MSAFATVISKMLMLIRNIIDAECARLIILCYTVLNVIYQFPGNDSYSTTPLTLTSLTQNGHGHESFNTSAVVRYVIASRHNQPNAFSAKLLVSTSLSNYSNNIVVDFLSYGWPIDCTASTVLVHHYIIIFLLRTLILMCKPILTLNYPGMPSPDPSNILHFPMTLFALLFKQCPKEVHQRDR